MIVSVLALASFSAPAHAACNNPVGATGKIVVFTPSNVPAYCNALEWISFPYDGVPAGGSGCSNPAGSPGKIVYNQTSHVLQYCNGTTWVSAAPAGNGGSGCVNPARPEGTVVYNTDYNVLQYCEGDLWVSVGVGDIILDNQPDNTGFDDVADAAMNTTTESNYVVISGMNTPSLITITGDGTPEFSINNGPWQTGGVIADGDSLKLRLTSANAYDTLHDAIVVIGGIPYPWAVTTLKDTVPNAFTFTDLTGIALSTLTPSNSITIAGLGAPTAVTMTGDGTPEFSINGGAWTTSGTIANGQTLQLRLTSSASNSTTLTATIDVGGITDVWTVRTLDDTTPGAFTFTDVTGATLSSLTTSNSITLSGITGATPVSVSGTGSPQISINGGAWTTSGSITNGQTLQVRLTSSPSNSTTLTATVNVGGVTDAWTVRTLDDTIPNAFTFTDVTGAALSTLTTSNSIAISGITGATSVSVSGTGSPQISIAGGAWTTSGSITNGQTLQVRLTSSAAYTTALTATVNVGGVTDAWSVTTLNDTVPNAFTFTDQTAVPLSTLRTSNSITIGGINAATPVSVSGTGSPQISIAGGAWTTSGSITNGQTLQVRLTSSPSNSTTLTATVNVGGVTDAWTVRTLDDTIPNAFTFTDQTAVPLSTLRTSNSITIAGINAATPVSVSGGGSPQISIAGGAWTTSGSITNGQTLQVRLTSSAAYTTALTATVNVGGVTDAWSVTTLNDTVPNAFNFTDVTGAELSTLTTSNTLTISGINAATSVSVSGGGSPQISINGGAWTTSGSITNGQTLRVRLTSSGAGLTALSATVNVGGVTNAWSVTTKNPLDCRFDLSGPSTPNYYYWAINSGTSSAAMWYGTFVLFGGAAGQTSVVYSGTTYSRGAYQYTDGGTAYYQICR
ncbi:beta strand repeat-containing protein [Micavibrio aeruginosavorus]|uniref:beta strand repeat-containing protein n=1 Tax=Micavibrio aeruginosavorus TaxID=349221 RepID=UPI003F4ACE6C